MLHKLLKERRLGHLKVGARTLITAEHLEQFSRSLRGPHTHDLPRAEHHQGRPRREAQSASRTRPRHPRHGRFRGLLSRCVVSRGAPIGRSANGRSSIQKGRDGRWHGYVSMGSTDAGKPVRRHVRGSTRARSPPRWRSWRPNGPVPRIAPPRTND